MELFPFRHRPGFKSLQHRQPLPVLHLDQGTLTTLTSKSCWKLKHSQVWGMLGTMFLKLHSVTSSLFQQRLPQLRSQPGVQCR